MNRQMQQIEMGLNFTALMGNSPLIHRGKERFDNFQIDILDNILRNAYLCHSIHTPKSYRSRVHNQIEQ